MFVYSVFWMLMEGVTVALKTSDVTLRYFATRPATINLARFTFAWGAPFIFATPSLVMFLSVGKNRWSATMARKYNSCLPDPKSTLFIYTLLVPSIACSLINLMLLARVIVVSFRLNKVVAVPAETREPSRRNLAPTAKLALALFPVLVIPMPFAFLVGKF